MCDKCELEINRLNSEINTIKKNLEDSVIHDFIISMDYHDWCIHNVEIKKLNYNMCGEYLITIDNLVERPDADVLQANMFASLYNHGLYPKNIHHEGDSLKIHFNTLENVTKDYEVN